MSWAKLDDQFFAHPKVIDLSKDAKLLYLAGLTYCAAQLTDGAISAGALRDIAALVDVSREVVYELVAAHLWEEDGAAYRIHDWRRFITAAPTARAEWDEMRSIFAPQVYRRDNSTCVYCGATDDLTIDHITPLAHGGANKLENLVTACRSCNSSKGARALGEWQR